MNLATHQRGLLHLIRSNDGTAPLYDDPYLRTVAQSKDLQEAKNSVFLWRAFVLARTAPMTFNLLKRHDQLRREIDSYIANQNLSPYRETHAPIFLERLIRHPNPLVARVAQFELALHRVRLGDSNRYTTTWEMNPLPLLTCLANDTPIDENAVEACNYEIVVARDLPGRFEVYRLSRNRRRALAVAEETAMS
jgi:hypothetical protein